ncbi:MAG: metalloregulator ArsR/SmtB family transcription factor [Dehalococcoidales bacterium]|jgi:ArsR family transcriptional regulator
MKELLKVHKALSDESRLRVLNLLDERECCVCEVMQALDISQSKASRILTALHDAGILKLHKEGLWSLYAIDWENMGSHLKDIVAGTAAAFKEDQRMLAERERLRQAKRVGPGCAGKMRGEKSACNTAARKKAKAPEKAL